MLIYTWLILHETTHEKLASQKLSYTRKATTFSLCISIRIPTFSQTLFLIYDNDYSISAMKKLISR